MQNVDAACWRRSLTAYQTKRIHGDCCIKAADNRIIISDQIVIIDRNFTGENQAFAIVPAQGYWTLW